MRLYAWNTAVSAAFYAPLQALEITLHNRIHNLLTEEYGAQWYDHPAVQFSEKSLEQLETVKSKLKTKPVPILPSDVVADLSFGFWVALFARHYEENLWQRALHKTFSHYHGSIKRKEAQERLRKLKRFCNRIAHHGPIFQMGTKEVGIKGTDARKEGIKNLNIYYREILETIGWMSPDKKAWVEAHSRIEEILAQPQIDPGVRF